MKKFLKIWLILALIIIVVSAAITQSYFFSQIQTQHSEICATNIIYSSRFLNSLYVNDRKRIIWPWEQQIY